MHDHDEDNRGEPDDQSVASVLKAFSESVAQSQPAKQLLKKDAPRKGSESLILEAKFWNALDICMKL
jgi:hypothetical protein